MRRMTYFVMALALVLGFTQCKKEQALEPENEVKTVNITLKVDDNSGAKHSINTTTGAVDFVNGDVIYVGNGSTYIGTLTRKEGVFSGEILEQANKTELYFYFVGGLSTDPIDLTGKSSFTVDISDQSGKMPVLSCNHVTYESGTTSYTCELKNQCALVQFTTPSTATNVSVSGLYTKAQINFASPGVGITNNGTTGSVTLNSESLTVKWAVLLPQTAFSEPKANVNDTEYSITMPVITADAFITGSNVIHIGN